jgi:CHAT domain-containing protein
VLTRDACHFAERGVTESDLARLAAAHQAVMHRTIPLAAVQGQAARLHDELLRPLLPFLAGQRVVVFVPDGPLQSVAFASLWDRRSRRYLVEDHVVVTAPSGSAYAWAASRAIELGPQRLSRALVVGNPRLETGLGRGLASLPAAEAEASDIAGLYQHPRVLVGARATKAAFLDGTRDSEVVHFAGHADSGAGSKPASLLFAPDDGQGDSGALRLSDLGGARLPRTRVVVLAACGTAAGAISRSEGLLSLGRPFLAAGVPSVVASLWDVDDEITRRFFVAFHRSLLAGQDPLLALRQTQLDLLRGHGGALAHPAAWAGFVAMGALDPRSLALPS